MTGKERALAVLAGDCSGPPPLYAVVTSDTLIERLSGRRLARHNALDTLCAVYRGHIDAVRVFTESIEPYWDEGVHTDGYGFARRTERWTTWIERRPFENTDEMADFIRDEIERFRAWKPGEEEANWLQDCDVLQSCLDPDVLFMGRVQLGSAPGSYFRDGLDNFAYLLQDYPDLVAEWAEARHRRSLRFIPHMARPDRCPIEFLDADIGYKTGLLVSPNFLRETGWFRRIAELASAYHAAGIKLILHSDGDLRSILPDLVQTGIDGLNPIETSAGMTLKQVREFAPSLLLVGGIPNQVLIRGTPAEVRACMRALKREMGGTPWWAGTSTEEFDESMKPENIEVIMEETAHTITS